MPAGIRKAHFVDFMQYKLWAPASGGAVFDNTPTSPWYADNAADNWFCGNDGSDNRYIYLQTAPVADTYLVNDVKVTDPTRISIDWAMQYTSPEPSGIYFMASSAPAIAANSYRVKQDVGANKVTVEKMSGAAVASTLAEFDYTPDVGVNYYRVRYYPQDYSIESDVTITSNQGQFIVYAGSSYNAMTELGTVTDTGTPLSTGSYHGLYIAALGSPHFYMYTFADDFWPLVSELKLHHSLRGPSYCYLTTPRFYYEKWAAWEENDIVQVFVYDESGDVPPTVTTEYDFLGRVQTVRQFGTDNVRVTSYGVDETLNQHVGNYTAHTGSSATWLGKFLNTPGGETYLNVHTYHDRLMTDLDVKTSSNVQLTSRTAPGCTDLDLVKTVCMIEDYYAYYSPECQFKVTDVWRDMTSTVINCGSWNSRFLDYDIVEDNTQTVTAANVYYDIGSLVYTEGANVSSLGSRSGIQGTYIDKHIGSSTEAGAIGSTLVARHGTGTYTLDCWFLARFLNIRPGDKVSFSLPHLGLGGDYDTSMGSWTPITAGVLEKEWSTKNNAVRLRLNATYVDGANTKAYQRDQMYYNDLLMYNVGQTKRSQSNHL